ncbi:MAG: hypothetical protein GXP48_00650 [Acidobacteria bacterium]|nr:hypothetical protein [Acidobacteriota bacterium]
MAALRKISMMIAGALAALVAVAGTAAAGPWVVSMAQPDTWQFTAAAWGRGRYVAATGDGIIAISLDGGSWRAVAGNSHWYIQKMAFGAGGFVAVGRYRVTDSYTVGLILHSPDGVTWSEAVRPDRLNDPGAIASSDGVWRVFDRQSVWTSRGGTHWTSHPLTFDRQWIEIKAVSRWKGGWIAVGSVDDGSKLSTGWIGTSGDAASWTTVATPARPLSLLAASPARLVGVGAGLAAWSEDGSSWTVEDLPGGLETSLTDLAWTGTCFVASGWEDHPSTGPVNGFILTSTDGSQWEFAVIDPYDFRLMLPVWALHALAVSPAGLIALGDETVIASAGGQSWQHRLFGFPSQLTQLVRFGGNPLAIQTQLFPGDDPSWAEVFAYGTKNGIAWGLDGGPWIKPTGIAWRFISRERQLFGYKRYIGRSVSVLGPDGQWRFGSLPSSPSSYPTGAAWGAPGIVVVETHGTIDFSTDGLAWSQRSIPGTHISWQNVVWTGSMFMAIGSQGEVAVSPDGLVWAMRRRPGNGVDASFAATNGNLTVVAGAYGSLAWTVDGRRWTYVSQTTSEDLNSVRWTGDRFVASGNGGAVLESADGRSWTVSPAPPLAVDLHGADRMDGRTIVIGQGSTIQVRLPSVPEISQLPAYRTVVPAVAHAPGVNGSFWNTSLTLGNHVTGSVLVWLRWLRTSGPVETHPFVVPGGCELGDVVETLFGASSGSGALIIDSDAPLAVSSRTTAEAGGRGPGQVLPGITPIPGGTAAVLPGLAGAPVFRTNIGLANLGGAGEHVTIDLLDADGRLLRRREVDVDGWQSVQLNRVFKGLGVGGMAWARVSSDGPFSTYASVIDNGTNDAATVLPAVVTSQPLIVPAAAHTGGANGAVWRSDLDLVDPGEGPTEVALELLTPEGGAVPGGTVTLGPQSAVQLRDVLAARFPGHAAGAIRITPRTGTVAAWSRTFDVTPEGTLGQGIPAVLESSAAVPDGGVLSIGGLRGGSSVSGWFHTNVGLVNVGDTPSKLHLKVEDAVYDVKFDTTVTVPANGWLQLLKVLSHRAVEPLGGGFVNISVTSGSSRVLAWASVIDNTSGDPSFLLGQTVPAAPAE